MRHAGLLYFGIFITGLTAFGQTTIAPQTQTTQPGPQQVPQPQGRSAGGDIGSGTGDAAKGAGKGVGKAAEGTGKGAGELVTLHPVGAAEDVGKGAGTGAKDAGAGAVKGTAKVTEGTGKLVAKPFHHKSKNETNTTPPTR